MRPIDLEEQKQIQLNILIKVDQFCREKNLRYSLGGGTLLGAVRHKGFIPWDDDIDIMMPRPDYDKFVHSFNGYDEDLTCEAYELNKNFMQLFAKVYNNKTFLKEVSLQNPLGIFIDVFPIDGFANNKEAVYNHVKTITFLRKLIQIKNLDNRLRWKRIIAKSLLFFVPTPLLQKKIQSQIQKYSFEKSNYAGATCGRYGVKECYPRHIFENYTTLPFEDKTFNVIKDYDYYLKGHYDDYMQLPPIKDRVKSHTEYAYWK